MKIQCFADDPREPDLIGETMVDLTEVLTKGETDGIISPNSSPSALSANHFATEWFTLMNKDKYCGEVYLELTFWSNVRHVVHWPPILLNYQFSRSGPPKKRLHRSHRKAAKNMLALGLSFHQGSYCPTCR